MCVLKLQYIYKGLVACHVGFAEHRAWKYWSGMGQFIDLSNDSRFMIDISCVLLFLLLFFFQFCENNDNNVYYFYLFSVLIVAPKNTPKYLFTNN
jgi:hypothetical protein